MNRERDASCNTARYLEKDTSDNIWSYNELYGEPDIVKYEIQNKPIKIVKLENA